MATTTDDGVAVHDSIEDHEEPAAKRPRVEELSQDVNSTEDDSARAQQSEPGDDPADINEQPEKSPTKAGRGGKRKFAILLSYCGKGYFGMQRNPDVRTIEEDLIQALYKAEAISEDMRDNLGKMYFQRCARTDKGVSAIRQLVSVKMYESKADKDKINSHLPSQIRVIAIIRVTKKFNSKDYCVARSYEYLLPTYALSPTFEQTRKDFRITSEQVDNVNHLLSQFVGTHNFHNFTSGKSPHEASAKRHIKEFCCREKFVAEGIEFLILRVKGQSFMLHQIRKMIGLVIAIIRNIADKEALARSFDDRKADIPMAPGLGLMLENVWNFLVKVEKLTDTLPTHTYMKPMIAPTYTVFYDGYNKRYSNDGTHVALDWEIYHVETDAFKQEHIYNHIIQTENANGVVMHWLGTIPLHSFSKKKTTELDNKDSTSSSSGKLKEEQAVQIKTELPDTASTETSSCKNV